MSTIRDMRDFVLQIDKGAGNAGSGAHRERWEDVGLIKVAVYKNTVTKIAATAKYAECTHTGLTYCGDLSDRNCRLKAADGTLYEIIYCDTSGRLSNLQLKEIRYGG